MLPEWLTSYFTFHKRERLGALVLLAIIIAASGVNIYFRLTYTQRHRDSVIKFGPSIARLEARADSLKAARESEWEERQGKGRQPRESELFPFDPNTLDSSGWVRLGFSPRQAAAILRFRVRGGFRQASDLGRVHVIDSAMLARILPYASVADDGRLPSRPLDTLRRASVPRELPMVDINLGDTLALEELRGIGPAFAARIYRYRERLGGFVRKEQLLEVYGMDSTRYAALLPQVTIDTSAIRRIPVNSAEFEELLRHPYLDKNQVRALLNYRKLHGPFRSVSDIGRVHIIKEEDIRRLAPYLRLE